MYGFVILLLMIALTTTMGNCYDDGYDGNCFDDGYNGNCSSNVGYVDSTFIAHVMRKTVMIVMVRRQSDDNSSL